MTVIVDIFGLRYLPDLVRAQMVDGEPGYPGPHAHVDWFDRDPNTEHTVTFDDPALPSSGRLRIGDTHQGVIYKTGTFSYRCTVHPEMRGTVVVTPVAATVPAADGGDGGGAGGVVLLLVVLLAVVLGGALAVGLRRRGRGRTADEGGAASSG